MKVTYDDDLDWNGPSSDSYVRFFNIRVCTYRLSEYI